MTACRTPRTGTHRSALEEYAPRSAPYLPRPCGRSASLRAPLPFPPPPPRPPGPPSLAARPRGLPFTIIPTLIDIARVRAAAGRARPHVVRTPLVPVEGGLLKLECLQPTGSFKVRGFFAAALAASKEQLAKGLMTVSAGNAAQACAYAAHTLGVPCRVVMFDTAPETKVEGVKRW